MAKFDKWWYTLRKGIEWADDTPSGNDKSGSSMPREPAERGTSSTNDTLPLCSGEDGSGDTEGGSAKSDGVLQLSGDGASDDGDQHEGGRSRILDSNADSSAMCRQPGGFGVEIRLNTHAPKVGRPKSSRQQRREQARAALKEYNRGIRLRTLFCDKDVCYVASMLHEIRPSLQKVNAFLQTHEVRNAQSPPGNVVVWRIGNEFVPDCARFRLSETVIDAALAAVKEGSHHASTQNPKSKSTVVDEDGHFDDTTATEVVTIPKVGEYTKSQLIAMKTLWALHRTCSNGMRCCNWLNMTVRPLAPDNTVLQAAMDEMLQSWPHTFLPEFGYNLMYSDLYRFQTSEWLSDNSIRAFAVGLEKTFKNNLTIFLPPADTGSELAAPIIPQKLFETVRNTLTEDSTTECVFLPVNLNRNYSVCLAIDRRERRVDVYDSLGAARNRKFLLFMAHASNRQSLDNAFAVNDVRTPTQRDSDSCGVFVCLHFWQTAAGNVHNNYSPSGLTLLRSKLLTLVWQTKTAISNMQLGRGCTV